MFTYAGDLTTDRDFVRFNTGDTNADTSFLSDEVIASLVATEGTKEKAVIAGLEYIITQLAKPDFRADWLSVDHAAAREGYERLLEQKRKKFNLTVKTKLTARAVSVYRVDSLQTDADYTTPTLPGVDDA